jgi:hypothetical protein
MGWSNQGGWRDDGWARPAASGGGGAMSLVLATASIQYLTRTWATTPTSTTTGTISCWMKLASVPSSDMYWYEGSGTSYCKLNNGSDLTYEYDGSPAALVNAFVSIADTTTWHHVCFTFDSTNATAGNRNRLWQDGVDVTGTTTAIVQNTPYHLADSGTTTYLGAFEFVLSSPHTYDGKIAYFHYIDGQVLAPSNFTTGTGSGTTHPIAYAGTYGTNGFKLDFSGSNTNDQSGNGRNWTQNNSPTFSTDVPT